MPTAEPEVIRPCGNALKLQTRLEDARIPVYIVATDLLSGEAVILSKGPAAQAIVASTAIPAAFAPVKFDERYLADGAITSCSPVKVAVMRGAERRATDWLRPRARKPAARCCRQRATCAHLAHLTT